MVEGDGGEEERRKVASRVSGVRTADATAFRLVSRYK